MFEGGGIMELEMAKTWFDSESETDCGLMIDLIELTDEELLSLYRYYSGD